MTVKPVRQAIEKSVKALKRTRSKDARRLTIRFLRLDLCEQRNELLGEGDLAKGKSHCESASTSRVELEAGETYLIEHLDHRKEALQRLHLDCKGTRRKRDEVSDEKRETRRAGVEKKTNHSRLEF